MKWLIGGRTGYTFLDVWSIAHFAFWVYVGSCTWSLKTNRWTLMAICLLGAYAWEVFEYYMAPRYPKLWLNPESWWNSWVSDPLMCVLGVLFMWYALDHWRVN